jgi:hypothetical protein
MRSSSSYRGAKKRAAREKGVEFHEFNERYAKSRHFAAAQLVRAALNATPEAAQVALEALGGLPRSRAEARRKLAVWAAAGGRKTAISPQADDEELAALNAKSTTDIFTPEQEEKAVEIAKKITTDDVDAALEKTLTNWQHSMHRVDPMPLSKVFAARARQLGWAEGVEFYEEK